MDQLVDLTPRRIGRPPSCVCGDCRRCRKAAYMRAWWARQSIDERRARVARRDPERHAARVAVVNAIRRGHLTRQPCHCGTTPAEAHHPDYAQRLQVEWLCRRHHVERHAA